jgi:hypothetical protein
MGRAKSYENLNFARRQTSKRGTQISAKQVGGGKWYSKKTKKI